MPKEGGVNTPNLTGGATPLEDMERKESKYSTNAKTKTVDKKSLKKKENIGIKGGVRKLKSGGVDKTRAASKISSSDIKSGLRLVTKPLNQKTLVEIWGQEALHKNEPVAGEKIF